MRHESPHQRHRLGLIGGRRPAPRRVYADEDRLRVAEESELVSAAVNAIRSHRYRRLEVNLDGDALTITKTIESGRLAPEVYDRQDPASAMAASGVAEHLFVFASVRPAGGGVG